MEKVITLEETIESRIFLMRGQKVMIDRDLAELYGVETKYLNRQVNRNKSRFPKEFMFRLAKRERDELVTNCHRLHLIKHSSSMPTAFTEHGVAMLSSVLNSKQAIEVNVAIVRTFIRLRELMRSHKGLEKRISSLERKYDERFKVVFAIIRKLIREEEGPRKKIGFHG